MRIANALAIPVQIHMPVLVMGEPGVGKTETIRALARTLGWHLEIVIASIREPSDFAGLPVIGPMGVRLAAPDWAFRCVDTSGICKSVHCPFYGKEHPTPGKAIVFFDEISTAAPAVQAALLRPIFEGVVGDVALPRTVSRVAAANPAECAAGGWDLTAPLANRFIHLAWKSEVDDWIQGSLEGWPELSIPNVPQNWETQFPEAITKVVSFIRAKRQLLQVLPETEAMKGKAWPSRRTWTMAARVLAACTAARVDDGTRADLIGGCVGEGAGLEFLSWMRALNLPSPEELMADPSKFKLPTSGDQQFTILTSVAMYAAGLIDGDTKLGPKGKEKVWNDAWSIFASAADQGAKDVAAVAVRTLGAVRQRHLTLPLPKAQIKAFIPILQKAGLVGE